MRKTLIIVVLFSLVVLTLLAGHLKFIEKGPPFTGFSNNISESKDKKVFEYEMEPIHTSLSLDRSHQLIIKSAWLENCWSSQVYMIGGASVEKQDNHQLIIVYDIIKNDTSSTPGVYYFLGGRTFRDSMVHFYCGKADTIKVPLYKEPTPLLPAREKRIAYDSLNFIRRSR